MPLIRFSALALIGLALPGCSALPFERANWLDWLRPASSRHVDADHGPLVEGRQYLETGHAAFAIDPLRRAMLLEGRTSPILNALGAAYAEIGRNDLSIRYFQEALAKTPDDPVTLNNIGYAALRQGQLRLARRYLEQASGAMLPIEAAASDGKIIENNMIRLIAAENALATAAAASRVLAAPAIRRAVGPRPLSRVFRRSERVLALTTRPGATPSTPTSHGD